MIALLLFAFPIAQMPDKPQSELPPRLVGLAVGVQFMLDQPWLHQELSLDESQAKRIKAIGEKWFRMQRDYNGLGWQRDGHPRRMDPYFNDFVLLQTTRELKEFLTEAQMARLLQVNLRQAPISVFAEPTVRSMLGLSEDQDNAILKIQGESKEKTDAYYATQGKNDKGATRLAEYHKIDAAGMEKILAILTPDQKAKWENALGAPVGAAKQGK